MLGCLICFDRNLNYEIQTYKCDVQNQTLELFLNYCVSQMIRFYYLLNQL